MLSPTITPGFHAIHANHLEDLRRAIVWICRENPLPPLEAETFLVQSNGIAQWLKLALAENRSEGAEVGGLGIAAGMEFLFPARFIWQAYRAVLPAGAVPETSPFDKRRLVWRLYRLLPSLVKKGAPYAPLARFLEGADPDLRCFQLAEKVADLFDQYQVFRADWLSDWEAGRDETRSARDERRPLAPELCWQPALWRALVEDVGEAVPTSRAHIHTRFLQEGQQLARPANPNQLPRRIVVFGVSSLPRQALEALHVLSRFSQVILCVHNPCQYYWADIISDRELLRAQRKRGKTHAQLAAVTDPDQLHQHANPLLAAWGKQGRDYIRLLDEFDNPDAYRQSFATPDRQIDIFAPHGEGEGEPSLLHQLQNDILDLTPLHEIRNQSRRLDPRTDPSLVFHQAHSPQREVEILHDQLLAAFNRDPALRPRDIIVMVPDINVYAPHIQAVFGRHRAGSRRFIPFTLSDQGRRFQEPVLIALETLLSLPQSRFGVSEILSLLEVPGVRQRFGIAEADLPLVRRWVEGANIRWGLRADQRADFGLPEEARERNTWQAGLRAMLLGYGMGREQAWQGVEPFAEIGGLQAALAGNLCQFIDQLEQLWRALSSPQTASGWQSLFAQMLERFFDQVSGNDLLLLNRFRSQLEQWFEETQAAGLVAETLPLNIVKDQLLEGLDEGGLNQRFLAGKVNFATLMPMRAIPFRRVCLLGMNDGDYPRSRPPVDFDLMAQDYRPGDRSRREDDRYLFLEAMLSAREQLYISWVARSIRDDSERPPSVLVGQLRDHLDGLWQVADGVEGPVSRALTTRHPLQPFSPRYFPVSNSDDQGRPRPVEAIQRDRSLFTYQREWRRAHGEQAAPSAVDASLSALALEEPLSLRDLANFLRRPVASFFQRRLQVHFEELDQTDTDSETFALDGLQKWRLDNELISECLLKAESDTDFLDRVEHNLDRMARRGELGMGVTEYTLRQDLSARLPDMYSRYQKALSDWPRAVEPLAFEFHEGPDRETLVVADQIDGLREDGQGNRCRLVVARSSLLRGSGGNRQVRYPNLISDWVIHLAGQLTGQPFQTLILAKEEDRIFSFPPLSPDRAGPLFHPLLNYWREGMTRPLPVDAQTAFTWIYCFYQSKQYRGDAGYAADKAGETYLSAIETDRYLKRSFPEVAQLVGTPEFRHLAETLYYPLWAAERGEADLQAPSQGGPDA